LSESALPKHYHRNFWCLAMDYGFFGLGMSFVSANTVIPGFLTALGASSAFIGVVSSIQSAGWLLPQLFASRYLADKPHRKRYILRPAAIGRSLILLLAVLVWVTGAKPPWLIMLLIAVVVAGFWVGDGLASVPWFDLFSSVIPPRRRGRMMSTGQIFSGVASFLAGLAVEWMLSDRGPAFPDNYALLFLTGFVMLALSFVAVTLMVDEKSASADRAPSWREYVSQLWRVFKQDHVFRRFIFARQIVGLSALSMPFYMPYALEQLGLPEQVAGRYTSIGVIGSILAAVAFGWLNEHYGSKRVLLISLSLSVLVPTTALLVPLLLTDSIVLTWGYSTVFFCLSAYMSSMMPGWMTYVLEWAPERQRPTYVGLTNTLNGIVPLFSTLGGLILQWTGENFQLLFAITVAGLLLAWPLALSLSEPRHKTNSQALSSTG
jgi:MFS family permease